MEKAKKKFRFGFGSFILACFIPGVVFVVLDYVNPELGDRVFGGFLSAMFMCARIIPVFWAIMGVVFVVLVVIAVVLFVKACKKGIV
ncbi:MAG: hypothetical protein LBG82_06570 [Clostridiales Family XIII bacterium]|jgi:hypothetical protein|nr:hypothetical protein [Clostridiales Family XIII bacterium]